MKSGQKLVVTLKGGERGVEIDGDKAIVTPAGGGGGLAIHNPDRSQYQEASTRQAFESQGIEVVGTDETAGKYYLLVGDRYSMSMECTFKIELLDWGDAKSGRDAGSAEETAIEVVPGVYPSNHLTRSIDMVDVFKFKAKGGVVYQLRARPAASDVQLQIDKVWNEDGNSLAEEVSGEAGAVVKVEQFSIPEDGYIFFRIGYNYGTLYSFALGEGNIQSPPKPILPPASVPN